MPELLAVSKRWRRALHQGIDSLCAGLETGFINAYAKIMEFKQSSTATRSMAFAGQKGQCVDRVLRAEPLERAADFCVKVGYRYRFHGERDVYRAEFKFDVGSGWTAPRVIWAHRDSESNGDPLGRAYS